MSTGTLSPSPYLTILDDAGAVCSGGLLYSYVSGTSIASVTYTDAALTVPNANPAVADGAGRIVAYLNPAVGAYKFIVKKSDGTTIRTVDPVAATNSGTSGLGEITVFGGNSASPITATSYPSGAGFDKLHVGTGVFYQDSAALASGTYVIEAVGQTTAGNTLTVAIVDLDDGAPDTPLATATISSTTGTRGRSGSITFATGGTAKTYGIKVKMDAGTGFCWNVRLLRTA